MGLYPTPETTSPEALAEWILHDPAAGPVRGYLRGHGVGCVSRFDDARDRVAGWLALAAEEWVNGVEAPPGPDQPYSTIGNDFLWEAEQAWFAAASGALAAPPTPESAPCSGFHLYRLWSGNRLVYVGVSTRLRDRLRVHRRRWGELWDRVTWEQHPDAASMLAAEADAIVNEDPALNRAGIK